jgi:hypothetical protein
MSIWDTWAADPRYSQVIGDPRFLQATPLFKSKIHDVLFKYGFTEGADPSGLTDQAIEKNPYSVASLLKNRQTEANHGTVNAAQAAGLTESGAAVAGFNANAENYKRGVSDAMAQQGGEISGALGDYTGTINNIFADVENNPVVPNTNPTGLTISGSGTALDPTLVSAPPGVDVPSRPTTNPFNVSVTQKLKAKKVGPVLGGMGHIT